MLDRIPEEVFQEWLAYFRLDPWDEYRGDLRTGILASIADADRVRAQNVSAPLNYMPYSRGAKKKRQPPAAEVKRKKEFLESFAEKWNKR